MKNNYRVGIVGATGAVGQELIRLLEDRKFPVGELRLMASARSVGKTASFSGKDIKIIEAGPNAFDELDLAVFSAGASTARALANAAVHQGCVVIDNSSAFRMDEAVPLVLPEINAGKLREHQGIIANPNCSTAIALMGLAPLHQRFGLTRFFASTYQSVSGTGAAAMRELDEQLRAYGSEQSTPPAVYPHPIALNVLPHVDVFLDGGYTKEEMKMLHESRKILGQPNLRASTTCVRVPVMRCHSVAIAAEFEQPVDVATARAAIAEFPGAELLDEPSANRYPLPLDFVGREKCGVGRVRRDTAFDNGLSLWVVGDQLWKGAALNAIQIAEWLIANDALAIAAPAKAG